MNALVWIKGLVSAGIGGAATAVSTMIAAPETFNLAEGKYKLASVAAVSALVAVANYLKGSPLPSQQQ
jgi:hypothetical protein